MKLNKGFAPIVIVLIVIDMLAVGGVAYFVGKSSNPSPLNVVGNNYQPQESQNTVLPTPPVQNNQVVNNTNCLLTTAPWIKVLSPNGGETYTAGQQVKIKWQSCNIPTERKVLIVLDGFDSMNSPYRWYSLVSAGSYTWTVPDMSAFHFSSFSLGFNAGGVLAKSGAFTINNNTQATAKLISFTGSNGLFSASSNGLTFVKVYYIPTGTGITQANLLGSMKLFSTIGNTQTWSMSAYIQGGPQPIEILGTNIYAVGYVGSQQQNQINYPYTGASDIYTHLY